MIARTVTIAVLLTLGLAPAPVDAQRRQRVVEVFGDDKCPDGASDEIIVCAKRPESDRYRIPTEFREPSATDRESQETRVDDAVSVGRTGTNSCSPVGPGGHTGCFVQQANQYRNDKKAKARARSAEPR